jgi:rfaE bifunctional protein kinase chain/domain
MKKLSNINVLICGDVMLDEYWFGDATRLSPEAPIPVVKIIRTEKRLGGAANVALNISNLGAKSHLVSICGKDAPGLELLNLLNKNKIICSLIEDSSIPTIEKLRIVARTQQMLRADFEELPKQNALVAVLQKFTAELPNANIVVLSDYRKGVLNFSAAMIAKAKEFRIPVLIDPKGSDWSNYRGATMLTPNKSELRAIIGDWKSEAELCYKAQSLRESLDLDYLLLTRSEEGMTLFEEGKACDFKAQAKEVYDVSGAGDTVIAVLSTLLAAGVDLHEAVRLANKAGGIVVGKFGTASVSAAELFSGESGFDLD